MFGFGVCLAIGLVVGFIIGILWRRKQWGQLPVSDPETALAEEGGLDDVLRLANANVMSDLAVLVAEHKVVEHMPGFFENFQDLIKQGQENYYKELWHILSHYRGERLQKLQGCGLKLSTQDLILLLLCELRKDNKTIAHLMGVNLETLKKKENPFEVEIFYGRTGFRGFYGRRRFTACATCRGVISTIHL